MAKSGSANWGNDLAPVFRLFPKKENARSARRTERPAALPNRITQQRDAVQARLPSALFVKARGVCNSVVGRIELALVVVFMVLKIRAGARPANPDQGDRGQKICVENHGKLAHTIFLRKPRSEAGISHLVKYLTLAFTFRILVTFLTVRLFVQEFATMPHFPSSMIIQMKFWSRMFALNWSNRYSARSNTSSFIGPALRLFGKETSGNVGVILGFTIIPIFIFIGAAIDYGRALNAQAGLQKAIDAATLAGAGANYSTAVATNTFSAQKEFIGATVGAPSFTKNADGSLTGVATASIPTTVMAIAGFYSIPLKVAATVSESGVENDCIIALGDAGSSASTTSITLNGAPVVNLQGCSIRSNQSLNCNGHSGNATSSIAGGTASGCTNPVTRPAISDIYAALASNISSVCGANVTGVSWTASSSPTTPTSLISASRAGYTEYHVCGDLNLSGTGTLTGSSPTTDTVVVIENGSINMANSSTVTANRMTFVFTGSDMYNHTINFPSGNGHLATLNIDPSITLTNPWVGVSLYQDPTVTKNVNVSISDIYSVDNMSWGPGGALNVDGIAYLPHADVTIGGNAGSASSPCTVLVVSTLTTNGTVNLNFQQQASSCQALGVKQFSRPIALTQ